MSEEIDRIFDEHQKRMDDIFDEHVQAAVDLAVKVSLLVMGFVTIIGVLVYAAIEGVALHAIPH